MLGFNVFTPPTPITTAAIKVLEEFPKFKSKYHPKFKSKYKHQKKSKKSTRVRQISNKHTFWPVLPWKKNDNRSNGAFQAENFLLCVSVRMMNNNI